MAHEDQDMWQSINNGGAANFANNSGRPGLTMADYFVNFEPKNKKKAKQTKIVDEKGGNKKGEKEKDEKASRKNQKNHGGNRLNMVYSWLLSPSRVRFQSVLSFLFEYRPSSFFLLNRPSSPSSFFFAYTFKVREQNRSCIDLCRGIYAIRKPRLRCIVFRHSRAGQW